MQFTWLSQVVGWLAFPLLAALAFVLLRHRTYREFPLFFVYVMLALLSGIVRWVAYQIGYEVYYFVYWTSALLLFAVGLAAVYDLFARRLFAGYQRVRFYRIAAPIAVAVVAVLIVATFEMPKRTTMFLIASRVLSTVELALLAFFGGLMVLLGRRWKSHEVGIASGFVLNQCAELLAALVRAKVNYRVTIFDQLPAWAFDGACILWLIYCWKAPEEREAIPLEREWLDEIKRVEQQLRDRFSKKRVLLTRTPGL